MIVQYAKIILIVTMIHAMQEISKQTKTIKQEMLWAENVTFTKLNTYTYIHGL